MMELLSPPPRIISHPPGDHRCVAENEIISSEWYNVRTSTAVPSQIAHYALRDGLKFLRSTSGCNETHLNAFKVILLSELPTSRILPITVIPPDDDPSMLWVDQNLSASENDIREGNTGLGPGLGFYGLLATVLKLVRTALSEPVYLSSNLRSNTGNLIAIPSQSHLDLAGSQLLPDSPESTMSITSTGSIYQPLRSEGGETSSSVRASSDEDKVESGTNRMAIALLNLKVSVERSLNPRQMYRVEFSQEQSNRTVFVVRGAVVRSINDGSFTIEAKDPHTGKWRPQTSYPKASLECKRKSGCRPALVLAQEVGELIAIAYNRYINGIWSPRDREVFVVGVQNDRMHFTTTEFPLDYFLWVSNGIIPSGEFLVIRRSITYDLSQPNTRKDAVKVLTGLMRHIATV